MRFNGIKKSKVYVAKATPIRPAVREATVKYVAEAWNKPEFKPIRKFVDRISIIKSINSGRYFKAGQWHTAKRILQIVDHSAAPSESYKGVVIHELNHAFYNWAQKYRPSELKEFCTVASTCYPINEYVRRNVKRWKNQNTFSFPGASLFIDEQHSAIAEIYYGVIDGIDKLAKITTNQDTINRLLTAYKKLHYIED